MKVVICSPLLSYPGHFLRVTKEKADCIRRAGMDVTVVGFRESFQADFSQSNLLYVSLEKSLPWARRRWVEKMSRRLGNAWIVSFENFWATRFAVKYARANNADVIFITDLEPWVIFLLVFGGVINRKQKIVGLTPHPYFGMPKKQKKDGLSPHSSSGRSNICVSIFGVPPFSLGRALLNHWLAPFVTRWINVICENQFAAAAIFGRKISNISIIPDGLLFIETSKEQKQMARRQLGIPLDRRVLLFFGVANPNKGAQLLYEALYGLEPGFVLLIVGTIDSMFWPQNMNGKSEHEISRWKENIIRVPRFVSEDERKLYFMACDAIALPYRKGFCVGSGCLQGGIVYGKAFIASDQYLVGHIVRTHGLGLLFPPEDVEKLRSCLREFARKPDQWFDEIEQRCRQFTLQYSWENAGAVYKKTFEAVCGRGELHPPGVD